jgi:hypothetical protein
MSNKPGASRPDGLLAPVCQGLRSGERGQEAGKPVLKWYMPRRDCHGKDDYWNA